MQLVGRDTVDGALDRRDRFECGVCRARNFLRNFYRIDQTMDLRNCSPVRLLGNIEVDFDTAHSRALDVGDANPYTIQSQRGR